jgi:malate dehydrogenase (quinone)
MLAKEWAATEARLQLAIASPSIDPNAAANAPTAPDGTVKKVPDIAL